MTLVDVSESTCTLPSCRWTGRGGHIVVAVHKTSQRVGRGRVVVVEWSWSRWSWSSRSWSSRSWSSVSWSSRSWSSRSWSSGHGQVIVVEMVMVESVMVESSVATPPAVGRRVGAAALSRR